jgi:hypothetical protein
MDSTDHLLTVGEIAVTLAGFSALVAILGGRRGRSEPRVDALRLRTMLEASLLVLAFSLFPLIPSKLGATPALSWRISAAAFLAVDLVETVFSLRRLRGLRTLATSGDRLSAVVVQVFAYSADALMFLVVLGVSAPFAAGFYFIALYANLVVAAVLFLAFAASTFVPPE